MSDKYFIDTNVFVYVYDEDDPVKQRVAKGILRQALIDEDAVISFQVIAEFIAASSKFTDQLPASGLRDYVAAVLGPLCEVNYSMDLIHAALSLREQASLSWWDAQWAGCKRLLTEDLPDGQIIGGVRIENPFASGAGQRQG